MTKAHTELLVKGVEKWWKTLIYSIPWGVLPEYYSAESVKFSDMNFVSHFQLITESVDSISRDEPDSP